MRRVRPGGAAVAGAKYRASDMLMRELQGAVRQLWGKSVTAVHSLCLSFVPPAKSN